MHLMSGAAALPPSWSILDELRDRGREFIEERHGEVIQNLGHVDVSGLVQAPFVHAFPENVVVAEFVIQSLQLGEVVDGQVGVAEQAVEHDCSKLLDVRAHDVFDFWVDIGVADDFLLLLMWWWLLLHVVNPEVLHCIAPYRIFGRK